MQNAADDKKGIATCILCGKPLKGLQVVKYRDWHAHAECAQAALKRQVDDFDRRPFWIGAIGSFIGILLFLPIIFTAGSISGSFGPVAVLFGFYSQFSDPTPYWVAFSGMAIALAFQASGLYGFAKNYDEGFGRYCALLAIAAAIIHFNVAFILAQFGYDPAYIDPNSGFLSFELLPNFLFTMTVAYFLMAILMVMVAIMILLLGESITFGFDNRYFVVLFVGAAALMPLAPFNFFVETIALIVLFLTARIPTDWYKIEEI